MENVLGGFVSLAISFLAAVLGLNGIARKVQKFIREKISPKIDKALQSIANKVKSVADKIGLTKLLDKSMAKVEEGKEWVANKKEEVKETLIKGGAKVLQWIGIFKRFKLGSENHTLLFADKGGGPEFMVRSSPTRYRTFINSINFEDSFSKDKGVKEDFGGKTPKAAAIKAGQTIDAKLAEYNNINEKNRKRWGNDLTILLNKLSEILSKYAIVGDLEKDVPSIVEWKPTNSKGHGKQVDAKQLSARYIKGDKTGDSGADKGLTTKWKIIQRNKGNNSDYYYVRGHLLNAKVGGLVNNTNLTPLSRKANGEHHKEVESALKKHVIGKSRENDKLGEKGIVHYVVNAIYGQHDKRNIPVLSKKQLEVKKAEEMKGVVPTKIKFSLTFLKIKDKKVVEDEDTDPIKGTIKNELPKVIKLK